MRLSTLAADYLRHMDAYQDVIEAPHSPRGVELLKRASAAAAYVDEKFETGRSNGDLKDFNKQFKSEREKRPTLNYGTFSLDFKRGLMARFCAELKSQKARY